MHSEVEKAPLPLSISQQRSSKTTVHTVRLPKNRSSLAHFVGSVIPGLSALADPGKMKRLIPFPSGGLRPSAIYHSVAADVLHLAIKGLLCPHDTLRPNCQANTRRLRSKRNKLAPTVTKMLYDRHQLGWKEAVGSIHGHRKILFFSFLRRFAVVAPLQPPPSSAKYSQK